MLQTKLDSTEATRMVTDRLRGPTRKIFQKYVPGRSFADIGCMWNCHGAYAYYAELIGARTPILAFDGLEATEQFHAYHEALESRIQFKQGDILELDPEIDGTYDVVFCSGVLYHMPDPMKMLDRVTSIARKTLILGTHTVAGDEPLLRFYPHDPRPEPFPWEMVHGASMESRYSLDYKDYAPWWVGPTESAVEQMLRCFRFVVTETERFTLEFVPGHALNPQISTFVAHRLD